MNDPLWADLLAQIPDVPAVRPQPVADQLRRRPRRRTRGEIAYELAQLATRQPGVPTPLPNDAPLSRDEYVALAALGWTEYIGARISPAGITLVCLRWRPGRADGDDAEAVEDERTPGGWRLEIAQ